MASALRISLTLLSVFGSLIVLLGTVFSILCRSRSKHRFSSIRLCFGELALQQRLQVGLCLLDSTFLLAATPLFVYYATKTVDSKSIWELALGGAATTFATTALLLSRPVVVAAWSGNYYLIFSRRKVCRTLLLVILATGVVLGISAATSVSCSIVRPNHSTPCATVASIRYTIVASSVACTFLAILVLLTLTKTLHISQRPSTPVETPLSPDPGSPISRTPRLICTSPVPSNDQIHPSRQEVDDKNNFVAADRAGLTQECAEVQRGKSDYGPNMVRGLLGWTGGSDRLTDAATTSLGYNSAVASSTNPYHIGSTVSLASRDTLAEAPASKTDFVASRLHADSRLRTSTVRPSVGPSTTSSSGLLDKLARPRAGLPRSSSQPLLDGPGSVVNVGDFKTILIRLIGCSISLLGSVVLSITALLMSTSTVQAAILLTSFCLPAAVVLLQEVFLSRCCTVGCPELPRLNRRDTREKQQRDQENAPCSRHSSASSSVVIVFSDAELLRKRRPHFRSYSCPLEVEVNGYNNELLELGEQHKGSNAKQRKSLSSARSVPYLDKHWAAGKVKGDLVLAPRCSFVRGLNLLVKPRPKLEILPVQRAEQDTGKTEMNECRPRRAFLPASVTSAIVEGLLDTPQRSVQMTSTNVPTIVTQESTQFMQPTALSSKGTLDLVERNEGGQGVGSGHLNQSRDELSGHSTDVILNMDDTPGSPRLQTNDCALSDHSELQSPTKQARLGSDLDWVPDQPPQSQTVTSSFSCNDQSHIMGNSASRLFTEIMDMMRGNGQPRFSEMPSGTTFGQSLKRTPPKGYTSIESGTAQDETLPGSSLGRQANTVIIHPDESSCDFRTASSHIATQASLGALAGDEHIADGEGHHCEGPEDRPPAMKVREEVELTRKGSTSSTFSISSISSRFRSLGRAAVAADSTPVGSPNTRTRTGQVKKVRSKTFASAFGIELSLLNWSGSKSRKGTQGTYVESSPSTSAGTCPSSLLDLSFSTSPATARQKGVVTSPHQEDTPPPGDHLHGTGRGSATRTHPRHGARADSIADLLEEDDGDALEEILNPRSVSRAATDVEVTTREKAIHRVDSSQADHHGSQCTESSLEAKIEDFDGSYELDVGDVTVNDVWDRYFPAFDTRVECTGQHKTIKSVAEDTSAGEESPICIMNFEMTRLAKAPFLDTVDEELEGETEADAYEHQARLSGEQASTTSNVSQRPDDPGDRHEPDDHLAAAMDAPLPERSSVIDPVPSVSRDSSASRENLLLAQEAKQRQIAAQLAEHEALFPHKTLSQIDEATELATLLRTSGYRTNSGASGSRLASDRLSTTTDIIVDHLGLPRSLRCQQHSVRGGADNEDETSTTDLTVEAGERIEADPVLDRLDTEARLRPFVTPRSSVRCRVAADRAVPKKRDSVEENDGAECNETMGQSLVAPSPRSVSERIGQLGLNQGIWLRSPIKLELEPSVNKGEDGSFQLIDVSCEDGLERRMTRLRKSLTLAKGRFSSDTKGAAAMRKWAKSDHHGSPKREFRDRMAKGLSGQTPPSVSSRSSERTAQAALRSWNDGGESGTTRAQEKRLLHKPFRKRRKSRSKGVAIMIARHQFTVVDEDDSLVQRLSSTNNRPTNAPEQP